MLMITKFIILLMFRMIVSLTRVIVRTQKSRRRRLVMMNSTKRKTRRGK